MASSSTDSSRAWSGEMVGMSLKVASGVRPGLGLSLDGVSL